MSKLHPPFPCYGGKFRHLDVLLPLIPKHHTYVEVFGGSAAILLNKTHSPVEIYNDIDEGATLFFKVLRDHTDELIRKVMLTPYSRGEYNLCWRCWRLADDPVEKARMWYFAAATSFSGRFGHGLSTSPTASSRGTAFAVSAYIGRVENLWAVASRLRSVIVENLDFREIIRRYDTPDTAFYIDPPYYPGTRDAAGTYTHELVAKDHSDLVDLLLATQGKVLLSGYDNPEYNRLEEAGWNKKTYTAWSSAALRNSKRGRFREETVWLNF